MPNGTECCVATLLPAFLDCVVEGKKPATITLTNDQVIELDRITAWDCNTILGLLAEPAFGDSPNAPGFDTTEVAILNIQTIEAFDDDCGDP